MFENFICEIIGLAFLGSSASPCFRRTAAASSEWVCAGREARVTDRTIHDHKFVENPNLPDKSLRRHFRLRSDS